MRRKTTLNSSIFTPEENNILARNDPEEVSVLMHKLPIYINEKLESCVALILGFKRSSFNGEWEIDHCNGRSSRLSEFINNKVLEIAKNRVDEIITPIKVEKIITELEKTLVNEIGQRYSNSLHTEVINMLNQRIRDDATKIVERSLVKVIKPLEISPPAVSELSDPKSCDTKMKAAVASVVAQAAIKPSGGPNV